MDAIKAIADGIRAEREANASSTKKAAPVSDEQVVNAVAPAEPIPDSTADNEPAEAAEDTEKE